MKPKTPLKPEVVGTLASKASFKRGGGFKVDSGLRGLLLLITILRIPIHFMCALTRLDPFSFFALHWIYSLKKSTQNYKTERNFLYKYTTIVYGSRRSFFINSPTIIKVFEYFLQVFIK